jgi:DNA-directed RNA polymerase subunit RPC12/RpoP
LIQKSYEIDPLVCQECNGRILIMGFIKEQELVKNFLAHVGV